MSAILSAALAKASAKKYLLPSTNSTIILPSGARVTAPDGVITADTPELADYLESMVLVGNATPYTSPQQLTSLHDTSLNSLVK